MIEHIKKSVKAVAVLYPEYYDTWVSGQWANRNILGKALTVIDLVLAYSVATLLSPLTFLIMLGVRHK